MKAGDYVLATKYSDGGPHDHWFVGFYKGKWNKGSSIRHDIVDNNGKMPRNNGFRRVKKITREQGDAIIANMEYIQAGSESLWKWLKVLTPTR